MSACKASIGSFKYLFFRSIAVSDCDWPNLVLICICGRVYRKPCSGSAEYTSEFLFPVSLIKKCANFDINCERGPTVTRLVLTDNTANL